MATLAAAGLGQKWKEASTVFFLYRSISTSLPEISMVGPVKNGKVGSINVHVLVEAAS